MGASGLDDPVELARLALERRSEVRQRRQEVTFDRHQSRDVQRGRDHVVAALAEVDVVVRVDLLSQQLAGAVGDHLVGIHVGAGSAAGLKHVDGKLGVPRAIGDLAGRALDRARQVRGQQPESRIHARGGNLDPPQGVEERRRQRLPRDGEILDRTLGLRAVPRFGRHLHLAQAVLLDAKVRPGRHRALLGPCPIALSPGWRRHPITSRCARRRSRCLRVHAGRISYRLVISAP